MNVLLSPPHATDQPTAPRYHAFLLRLWSDGDQTVWHASLQATDASTRRGFADLNELQAFLRELCCPPTDDGAHPPDDT